MISPFGGKGTMETAPDRGSAVIVLAFGLPIMTTAIVVGSMYVGHIITNRSDRPSQIVRVESATPKIDVNVPQAAPPNVQIATQPPKVDVHIPVGPAPTVTVNTPPPLAPNITVNPPPASVTIIDRHEEKLTPGPFVAPEMPKSATPNLSPKVDPAPTAVSTPADAVVTQPETIKQLPGAPVAPAVTPGGPAVPVQKMEAPVKAKATDAAKSDPNAIPAEPTLENLYQFATRYVDLYCTKHGLDPIVETKRWNKMWQASVEQSIADNIDSSEQTYINRTVIAKRDCFNLATATPDKIVEACRILLRYRDGQLAWLQAMKDALTNENLRKSITLLAAGP
jgi:hypothetical protein